MDFTDPLTGPTSPALSIPYDNYTLTADGLLRSYSVSADKSGVDRPMVKTYSGSYLSRNFTFEATVTIPETIEDIAYLGFGEGTPNVAFHNEPTNAFLFRIHHIDGIRRIDCAVATRTPGEPPLPYYAVLHSIGNYTPGESMRFRIERRGDVVTMSVPAMPGAEQAFKLSDYAGLFGESDAYLFLGNTTEGTVFQDVSVTP